MTKPTVAILDARTQAHAAELASLADAIDKQSEVFHGVISALQDQLDALKAQPTSAPVAPVTNIASKGVTCGKCSQGKNKVKHANVQAVKACYSAA